jgi:hypothetical protein
MRQLLKSAVTIFALPVITCAAVFLVAQVASGDEQMNGNNPNKPQSEEIGKDICQTLPRSILCEMKQAQERARIEAQKKLQELEEARKQKKEEELKDYISKLKKKNGYNPLFYIVKLNLYGNTLTVFSSAGWIRMTVDSENGDIYALYTEVDRDFWTGAIRWHDKKTVNVSFTLDPKACEKFSAGKNCTFSGTDKVSLGSFYKEHELIKYGTWTITYLNDKGKKNVDFRVPLDKKPEESNDEFNPKNFRAEYCQKFPESLACLYLANK